MKILALQGSPRRQSQTHDVLQMVLNAAKDAGAQTELIDLCDMVYFTGCNQCEACQGHLNEPGCCLPDDMQQILRKALAADMIIWATPVVNYSPAWLLKMAMDRMSCMLKPSDASGDCVSLLKGRKMAAVIVTGRENGEGAHLVFEMSRHVAESAKAKWIGALITKEAAERAELAAQAAAFGRQLVA